jgi:Protein of unknown function (DUF2934)
MIKTKELSKEDIAHRAYQLYIQRGSGPGNDVEDWLKAENELVVRPIVTPARMKSTH